MAGGLDQWEEGTNLKGSVLALTDLDPRLETTGLHWRRDFGRFSAEDNFSSQLSSSYFLLSNLASSIKFFEGYEAGR